MGKYCSNGFASGPEEVGRDETTGKLDIPGPSG